MKIFISWDGERSHAVAVALGDWIPSVIQAVETCVSSKGFRKGTNWFQDVSREMNESSLGILCVDSSNIGAPWLNFEAGVLSRSQNISKVIPLLVDVEKAALDNGPLAQFPSCIYGKNEIYQILEAINENTGKSKLSEDRLQNTFEVWWPRLDQDVGSAMGKRKEQTQRADTTERAPERTIEPARKSEIVETKAAEKPAKPDVVRPPLEKIEIEILRALYESPEDTPIRAAEVGYKFDIPAQKATEHLDKLERENYIREHLFIGRPKEYSIARKGKEYLTKHGLLSKRQT